MTTTRRSLSLRLAAVLLLAAGSAIYSAYGHLFYAGFVADCRNVLGADLNDAGDGTPDINWLYSFLIGALPLACVSRPSLLIMSGLFFTYDFFSVFSLLNPYTGSDCGIHGGNDQDFTGSYVVFVLGYALLVILLYVILLADVATRGVRALLRLRERQEVNH